MVSSNYAIELLKKSLNLYTPSRSEGPLANLLKDKCINELGFELAHIDSVGNIIMDIAYQAFITILSIIAGGIWVVGSQI